jgi:hypothetical protein
MEVLGKRHNILFLITVRDKDLYFKLLFTRIHELYIKVNKALTFHESNEYGDHWYIKSNVKTGPWYSDNDTCWHIMGLYHRIDGPTFKNNHMEVWRQNGEYYRENGPSMINQYNGLSAYKWYNMKGLHREPSPDGKDRPASISGISKRKSRRNKPCILD